jgi:carbohydrate esterase-like sialic acid-specific acetylesterase
MLRRYAAAGGRVRGVLWYHGESDAVEKTSAGYGTRFRDFIRSLRADVQQQNLTVYYVQIGRFVAPDSPEWNKVQLAQWEAEAQIPGVALASAIDLELLDEIHIDIASLKRVGRRLANLACADLYPSRSDGIKRGPRPVAARIEGAAKDRIAVTFSGVNGRLAATGRLSGFSLRDPVGADLLAVNDAVLDPERPDTVVLQVKPHAVPASGATLWYGWGNNPYCNLRDEKDMAAPVATLPIRSN